MKVQEVLLDDHKRMYLLLDDKFMPVMPVAKYLKYLDNTGKSPNTLKTYCYALKLYFEYLDEINTNYSKINISILSDFVAWLRNPHNSSKVISIQPVKAKRTEKTVNLTITVVTNFYDYLFRSEEIENDMIKKVMKKIFVNGRASYKDFLYHVNKDKPSSTNILKLKVPRRKLKVLSKDDVEIIFRETSNIRDQFLLRLLFETGLRIGEALSLHYEDIIFDHAKGHRIRLKDRGELINGARLKTGEREIYISDELMNLFDDYAYSILDEFEVDTNFLFVKIRGENKGFPLEYNDVSSLFKRLKKRTGLKVHPHLLRHTHATIFYKETKNIKQVQERLGHSTFQTTMNLYLHPNDDEIRENWELAQHAFKIEKEKSDEGEYC